MPSAELHGLERIVINQFYHDSPTVAQLNCGELPVGRLANCERHVYALGRAHLIRLVASQSKGHLHLCLQD